VINLNISVDTKDFEYYLDAVFRKAIVYSDRCSSCKQPDAKTMNGIWLDKYELFLSKIITHRGFCYTFNYADANDLFNLENVATIFDYHRGLRVYLSNFLYYAGDFENRTYPVKTTNYLFGLTLILFKLEQFNFDFVRNVYAPTHQNNVLKGHEIFFHRNFDVIAPELMSFYATENTSSIYWIDPQMMVADPSLENFSLEQ
jgi:Amiloride-sensitive sodium channel